MALIIEKKAKRDPLTKKTKFHPSLKSIKKISEKDVAKAIADETTLNPKEAEMVLAQFQKILLRFLLSGYTVSLSDWASFFLTVTSNGADTEKECTANLIKGVHAHCRFGKEFREALAKAEFVSAEKFNKKEE